MTKTNIFTSRDKRIAGIFAITASAFGFALMAACVRWTDDFGGPISSFQKSFFRNVVALLIALAALARPSAGGIRRLRTGLRGLTGASAGLLLLRSLLGTCGIFANFYALGRIPIAEGQTLNKTAPFFTVLFAGFFLRERFSARQMTALAIAFAGILLVTKPCFAGAASFPLAMGLLGGVCAGGAYVCVRALKRAAVDSALIVFVFSAFSCLASVPFMVRQFDPMTLRQVGTLLGAGIGAAIGQFGITAAYGFAAPREIAVYDYSNILFTAAFGWLLFAQVPDMLSIVGFTTIVLAAIVLNGTLSASGRLHAARKM